MISPVVVEARKGAVTAHCMHEACRPTKAHIWHQLYAGMDIRSAERAADAHLKDIRDGEDR